MRINLVTLGCSKNTVDSEKLLKQLEINGFEISHNSDEFTDIVIINTCGFILDAKQESIETILRFCHAKEKGFIESVLVIGCLSERYKNSLKEEIPQVDEFFGVNDMDKILSYLGVVTKDEYVNCRILSTPSHYAYLKVSEGCNRKCSFCAIPMIRGKQVSSSLEDLIDEAHQLQLNSVKELILIAQDITNYGTDIYKRKTLLRLLEDLCAIKGFEWIRIHYLYPDNSLFKDLTGFIQDEKKICRYIDVPFQHISNRILNDMNRGYDKEDVYEIISGIRSKIPGVALRTTLITGFPGESEKEFAELYEFVQEMKFDRLGVFAYSHENDTPAWKSLADNVPGKVKMRRVEELMELQQEISYEKNLEKIGKTMKVIIDGEEGEFYKGRTEYDSPEIDQEVLIPKSNELLIKGDFYEVQITDAMEFDLFGTVNQLNA